MNKLCSRRLIQLLLIGVALTIVSSITNAKAVQNPQNGSVGLEGTIGSPPPTQAATIAIPTSGQTFNANPITVSGLCPTGLLIKIFSNNVFVGSVQCTSGSYSISIDLFLGQNDIIARDFDALDQAGPDSNSVTVTLNGAQFSQFGTELLLTSSYAKRGANPGQELDWPIVLSGGTGPYALSVDWGDGKTPELLSSAFIGNITISHTYSSAGVFVITVRATDKNGQAAFLQLVGVSNGPVSQSSASNATNGTTTTKTVVLWWPAVTFLPLIIVAFWLGRRHELFNLRRQLERSNERRS